MALTDERTTQQEDIRAAAGAVRDDLQRGRREAERLVAAAGDIAGELQELAKREVELARAEVADATSLAGKGAMFGGVAALFGHVGLIFVAVTAMLALALVVELWLAALIVTVALLAIAGIAALMSRSRFNQIVPPGKRTAQSVREDVVWLRKQTRPSSASANSGD
jgi:uncharacterized membrane protein YqjE